MVGELAAEIGPDQRIAQVWPKVSVTGHAEEVLAAVKAL